MCNTGYELPLLKKPTVDLKCSDGKWVITKKSLKLAEDFSEDFSPSNDDKSEEEIDVIDQLHCAPVCKRPCQNNGTCVGPDLCKCTQG